jgi:hypothetical protein
MLFYQAELLYQAVEVQLVVLEQQAQHLRKQLDFLVT